MAGLLQNEFEGDYKVLNHSISGWGHSQSYLRFDDIKENLDESDILIFIYAQYLLPRNASTKCSKIFIKWIKIYYEKPRF